VKLITDRYEAPRGLFATAELLVNFLIDEHDDHNADDCIKAIFMQCLTTKKERFPTTTIFISPKGRYTRRAKARVYFKRGVQPKCGVQTEKCGVKD